WSPDGSELAFLRKKGDKPQVWIMPANGGEARPVTDMKHGVSTFKWSPDSARLLVRSEAEAAESTESEESDKDDKNKLPEEKIINRIKYKADGAGFWNERRHHLYLVNPATEECKQITEGDFDIHAFAWSPDGTRIAYSICLATEQFPDPDFR
ncbi:S9 family peptidase, partial [Clostridium perfringens]